LNGGGWRKPLAVVFAIGVGSPVHAFDAIRAQHGQTAAEFRQFITTHDRLVSGAACHDHRLPLSPYVRHSKFAG
jgi:hypothetical protein